MTAPIRHVLLAMFVLTALPASLRAQEVPEPGTRVRVLAPALGGGWIAGTVSRVDSAAVRLLVPPADATLLVPLDGLQRLQASRGRGGATLEGAIAGGTLGALIGFLALQPGGDGGSCARGCGGASGGGFLIGAGVGTLVGGVLGSLVRAGAERWREIPLPLPRG